MATAASTIVGSSTRKPQKMKACISPGTAFWKSLRCPRTWVSSRRTRTPRPIRATGRTHRAQDAQARSRAAQEDRDREGHRGRQRQRAQELLRRFNSCVRAGTTWKRSPTTPRSDSPKMGASASLLMATIRFAPFIPTTCWVAPLMPTAR